MGSSFADIIDKKLIMTTEYKWVHGLRDKSVNKFHPDYCDHVDEKHELLGYMVEISGNDNYTHEKLT